MVITVDYKASLPFNLVFSSVEVTESELINKLNEVSNDYTLVKHSYFRKIFMVLKIIFDGEGDLTSHLKSYFNSDKDFKAYHLRLLTKILLDSWESLGKPKTLVINEPEMSPYLEDLSELYPQAKFI